MVPTSAQSASLGGAAGGVGMRVVVVNGVEDASENLGRVAQVFGSTASESNPRAIGI